MEDFILREINRIGELVHGLLIKLRLRKEQDGDAPASTSVKTELAEKLHLSIDTLLAEEDFIRTLCEEHGFGSSDLELFAELLADLAAAAEDPAERKRLAVAACTIYRYQDAHGADVSFNRYYILKELVK